MTLRTGLILALVVGAVAALVLLAFGHGVLRAAGVYFLVQTVACLVALIFERSRYRPAVDDPSSLRPTGERMIDPTSGDVVDVWEDPRSGQREYRKAAR